MNVLTYGTPKSGRIRSVEVWSCYAMSLFRLHPNGFHPKLSLSIPHWDVSRENCTVNVFLSIPPLLFVDPYELADYKHVYTFRYWGPSSLELPLVALGDDDSTLLIHANPSNGSVEVEIPLHARYGLISDSINAYQTVDLRAPQPFLSCTPNGVWLLFYAVYMFS